MQVGDGHRVIRRNCPIVTLERFLQLRFRDPFRPEDSALTPISMVRQGFLALIFLSASTAQAGVWQYLQK